MDKYELSIKEDKIRKHAENKDYEMAAQIADTVDWNRVRNIKMLTLVSQIYEKTGEYGKAKDVLVAAYEHVPVGRRMVYKLTELCIKAGKLSEAEEFFEEFQELAPNDINKLLLAYQLGAAEKEPINKLILILEMYRKSEFEEKWAYELAELYHRAGRIDECVQLCNEIILWFSVGPYVEKAMRLKMQYEPLSPDEQDKYDNKKKFEDRIKAVEKEFEQEYEREAQEEELKKSQSADAPAKPEKSELPEETPAETKADAEEAPEAEVSLDDILPEENPEETEEAVLEENPEPAEFNIPSAFVQGNPDLENTQEFGDDVKAALGAAWLAGISSEEEVPAAEIIPEEEMPAAEIIPEEEVAAAEIIPEAEVTAAEIIPEEEISVAEIVPAAEIPAAEIIPEAEVPAAEVIPEAEEPVVETEIQKEDMTRMQDGLETGIDATQEFLDQVTAALAASAAETLNSIAEEAAAAEQEKISEESEDSMAAGESIPEGETEPEERPEESEDSEEKTVFAEETPAPSAEEPAVSGEIEIPAAFAAETENPVQDENTVSGEGNRVTCVVIEEKDTPQRVSIAVEKLKKTHEILGLPATKVAKISGSKLNVKGVRETIAKLDGRDLIIDYAADLSAKTAEEIAEEIANPFATMVILLVDTPERIDDFLLANPELDQYCLYLEDDNASYDDIPIAEPIRDQEEEKDAEKEEEEPDERMSVEDFAACVKAFAEEEECVLDEAGELAMLALVERMRNAGSSMDELSARHMVEEAIEKAEHRGFRGLFTTKYDKNGFLILKEDCFRDL